MSALLETLAWLACAVYSTIPSFWLAIHPHADFWRARLRSPYRVLVPLWVAMWIVAALITLPWRHITFYNTPWSWLPAVLLFAAGFRLYSKSIKGFSARQLGGTPEVMAGPQEQRLVTSGIRSRVRHPVYLGHLCEMVAWSVSTGLAVSYTLTAFAIATGALMVRLEDKELEQRFGEEYRKYRDAVPAVVPRIF